MATEATPHGHVVPTHPQAARPSFPITAWVVSRPWEWDEHGTPVFPAHPTYLLRTEFTTPDAPVNAYTSDVLAEAQLFTERAASYLVEALNKRDQDGPVWRMDRVVREASGATRMEALQ